MPRDNLATKHMSLLIVGAGLSGLMMAAQCLRNGLYPVLIDQTQGPKKDAGMTFLHARSLELLDQMGLAQEVLAKGQKFSNLSLLFNQEQLELSRIEPPHTSFPYVVAIHTAKLEKLLIEYLTSKACTINWNTKLLSMRESEQGIVVEVSVSGVIEHWKSDWMAGADGRNSLVRNTLGFNLESADSGQYYFQLEMSVQNRDTDLPEGTIQKEAAQLWVHQGQLICAFPLQNNNRVLLCGVRPTRPFSKQELLPYLHENMGHLSSDIRLEPDPKTLCMGQLDTHVASKFAGRRVFLVGDAAHHFPSILGQGANTCFLDAWNLGWKLAGVVQGRLGNKVLLTYHKERSSQARKSLGFQGSLRGFTGPELVLKLLQHMPGLLTQLLPSIVKYWAKPQKLSRLFSRFAGLQEEYRDSALAVHYARSERVRAGDRFPWFPLYDEKQEIWTHTYAPLNKPHFVLIILGNVSGHSLHILGQWIKQKYPQGLSLFYIPFSQTNHLLFEHFEVNHEQVQAILVRPDTHIAYVTNFLYTPLIDDYLVEAMEWKLYLHFE